MSCGAAGGLIGFWSTSGPKSFLPLLFPLVSSLDRINERGNSPRDGIHLAIYNAEAAGVEGVYDLSSGFGGLTNVLGDWPQECDLDLTLVLGGGVLEIVVHS